MSIFLSPQDCILNANECVKLSYDLCGHNYTVWCKKENAGLVQKIYEIVLPVVENANTVNRSLQFDKIMFAAMFDALAIEIEKNDKKNEELQKAKANIDKQHQISTEETMQLTKEKESKEEKRVGTETVVTEGMELEMVEKGESIIEGEKKKNEEETKIVELVKAKTETKEEKNDSENKKNEVTTILTEKEKVNIVKNIRNDRVDGNRFIITNNDGDKKCGIKCDIESKKNDDTSFLEDEKENSENNEYKSCEDSVYTYENTVKDVLEILNKIKNEL